ncbi:hypothetical protein ABTX81_01880 [Kitasatospora sp. NPDC097605]|uniref:hypothetical protein n=1 Tax=Kitasatospora sp. NPDC097605 TaxID=3157226 RepID=UPI003332D3F2
MPTTPGSNDIVGSNDGEPDVAIDPHPKLGMVAAVTSGLPTGPAPLLTRTSWKHMPALDLYQAPVTDRPEDDNLAAAARATARLQRGRYTAAVQPDLAAALARSSATAAHPQHP